MKNIWVIIGVVVVLLIGASVVLSQQLAKQANEGVVVTEHVKGNLDASVVLREYSDFQCPACAQFQPVIRDLVAQYGDSLRFEYRHFPLVQIHPSAAPAALAAEAAGQQGKFFEFHDRLFEQQAEWSGSAVPQVFFEQYATELGLDIETFKRHQRSSLLRAAVQDDLAAAREKGFTGTPTFELNGERMQFQTFEEFVSQIETALGVTPPAPAADGTDAATPDTTTTDPAADIRFGI